MADGSDDNERTEEPTPERRKKARDDGQFARARDTTAVAGTLREFCLQCFHEPLMLVRGDMTAVIEQTVKVLVMACMPVALFACAAGMAAGFAEAGFHPNFETLEPKFERLEPLGKLRKLFGPKEGLVNVGLSLLRVGIVGAVA